MRDRRGQLWMDGSYVLYVYECSKPSVYDRLIYHPCLVISEISDPTTVDWPENLDDSWENDEVFDCEMVRRIA